MEDLVRRAVEGDDLAWRALWLAVEPTLWGITGKWRITGPLSQREDDRRNIVVEVMSRLRADDFRRLRAFLESIEQRGGGSFKVWIATVTAHAAIDYVRAHEEYASSRAKESDMAEAKRGRWVHVEPMPDSEPMGAGADVTQVTAATLILGRACRVLERDQLDALHLWLQDCDHAEIAKRLELPDARAADKLVRAALKRLRDRYASRADDGEIAGLAPEPSR